MAGDSGSDAGDDCAQAVLIGLAGAKPCPICRDGMRRTRLRFEHDLLPEQGGWHCWKCAHFELVNGDPIDSLARRRILGMWAWMDEDD